MPMLPNLLVVCDQGTMRSAVRIRGDAVRLPLAQLANFCSGVFLDKILVAHDTTNEYERVLIKEHSRRPRRRLRA